jgi:hypothetical protein
LRTTSAGYDPTTMTPTDTPTNSHGDHAELREALRGAASALKGNGPRFALAGSYALWAYGAPEPSHDVDLVIAESDAATATATLRDAGFTVENPPEDWLFKACSGDTVVDVLHRINGVPVEPALLECAEQCEVLAITMPVLPPTMVLIQKLRALNEHHCDFAKLLPAVRAIRERLDWGHIRSQTADNDYAVAFLVLADRLGLTG